MFPIFSALSLYRTHVIATINDATAAAATMSFDEMQFMLFHWSKLRVATAAESQVGQGEQLHLRVKPPAECTVKSSEHDSREMSLFGVCVQ